MRVLIATAKKMNESGSFNNICEIMRKSAAEGDLIIPQGILWTGGPGCANLAFDIIGPDSEAEQFANALTMALMPAKWSTTSDKLPEVDTNEIGLQ